MKQPLEAALSSCVPSASKPSKTSSAKYVRAAAAGETVLVTDRNTIVAELVPPRPNRPLSDDEFIAQGWLTPAKALRAPLPPRR